jgi:hypothetical protein
MGDMLNSLSRSGLAALAVTTLVAPPLAAQAREVISKQVSVGRSEAELRLEFSDDDVLDISFDDGVVRVDGTAVGTYEPGDALDAAWRSLLGQAVSLDDGALAEALSDWRVPAELAGRLADVAQSVDGALERALNSAEISVDAEDGTVSVSIGDGSPSAILELLLNSSSRLGLLEQALDGLGPDYNVHLQESVDVGADEVIDGNLVVIEGNVRIEGEVDGDVVVVSGDVELLEGSRVTGELRLADARVVRNLGEVRGGVVDMLSDETEHEAELRDQIRTELRAELRSDLRDELRSVVRSGRASRDHDDGWSLLAPFRPVIHGVGGLLENLLSVLVLGLIGAGIIAFAGSNLDVVSEAARESPGRAVVAGMAGTFLLIPVWLLGTVALAVSIIGIPVAIAWLPLFPIAAAAAAVLGYLAVARNAGEWLADSDYPWTGWIRRSNPIYTMLGGLLGLTIAFMAANVISIAPFLGFLSGLLVFAGALLTFFAIQIGFGAVILTRAGRRRDYSPERYDADAAWQAAMDVDVEIDVDVDAADEESSDAQEVNDA